MWFIKRKHDGKQVYLVAKEYSIGRKACTIEISDDATVSRKHCKIIIEKLQDGKPSSLKVMDLNSTFGVYINLPDSVTPIKLNPNEWKEVKCHSTIVFGTTNHWVLGWQDIPVLVSGNVNPDKKKRLQSLLEMLGGKVCHDWNPSVMFLVMDKIAFTQKVLEVLLAAIPITTVEYFERWFQSLDENPESPLPNSSDYLPPLDANLSLQFKDHNFLPNPHRRILFAGKTFLFPLPGQLHSTAAKAIRSAGGQVVSGDHASLNEDQLVVIDRDSHATEPLSNFYVSQAKQALSRGERLVPEREISLAILSSSCQRYCNPRYVSASAAKEEQKATRKTERELDESRSAMEIEEPPTKKHRIASSEESMEVVEPPSKKHKSTTSDEASKFMTTLKSTFRTTSPTPPVKPHEENLIDTSKRYGKSSRTSRTTETFLASSRCSNNVNNTIDDRSSWLRSQNSLLEKSQVVRTQSFRSNPISSCQKIIQKTVPKRIAGMKTLAFKDGKWI